MAGDEVEAGCRAHLTSRGAAGASGSLARKADMSMVGILDAAIIALAPALEVLYAGE